MLMIADPEEELSTCLVQYRMDGLPLNLAGSIRVEINHEAVLAVPPYGDGLLELWR